MLRPKIISRYIISEALGPFLVGTFLFTFFFITESMTRVIKLVIEQGASLWHGMQIFVYMLPFNLAVTLPMGVLMGSIMAYGRLSGDSEIIAMKSSGLNIVQIYKPIALFGVIFFCFMTFFNEIILPEANYRYSSMMRYIMSIQPSLTVEKYKFLSVPNGTKKISATYVRGADMRGVTIYDDSDPSTRNIITATSGKWVDNVVNASLIKLVLTNGMIQRMSRENQSKMTFTPFNEMTLNISRQISGGESNHYRTDRELPSWEIRKRIVEGKRNGINQRDMNEHVIEMQKKFAIPFACFIFVMLGGPLGTVSRRSGKGVGFGISAMIIFVYYMVMIITDMLGKNGKIPAFIAPWTPDIVLGITAVILFRRMLQSEGK